MRLKITLSLAIALCSLSSCSTPFQTLKHSLLDFDAPKVQAINIQPANGAQVNAQPSQQECVILLHGLLRSSKSMKKMASLLDGEGYRVVNQDYPSRDQLVSELAAPAINAALGKCGDVERVNFVTHSMGGILVRYYLSKDTIDRLGRVVMLAPPNQGSEVPDKLREVPGFNLINGPAGAQLGTNPLSIPSRLGPADFDLGIIAGSKSINLVLSRLIPEQDDGKVSVESTKLEGMRDHIVLPVSHPFIMTDAQSTAQTLYYLKNGKFNHALLNEPAKN